MEAETEGGKAVDSLGATESFTMIGRSVTEAVAAVAAGHAPRNTVDRPALDHPAVRERPATFAAATEGRPQAPDLED